MYVFSNSISLVCSMRQGEHDAKSAVQQEVQEIKGAYAPNNFLNKQTNPPDGVLDKKIYIDSQGG